ncbi:hypothetical protein [Embleya sp. AB8]|uniref:hypothetical protein n=1 Tax=Embleya sp. AB8 TaxID=3156304 RepID=UPI003C78FCCC
MDDVQRLPAHERIRQPAAGYASAVDCGYVYGWRDVYERRDGVRYFARRRHDLWYGANVGADPVGPGPANRPEQPYGSGTVPGISEAWREFCRIPDQRARAGSFRA